MGTRRCLSQGAVDSLLFKRQAVMQDGLPDMCLARWIPVDVLPVREVRMH